VGDRKRLLRSGDILENFTGFAPAKINLLVATIGASLPRKIDWFNIGSGRPSA
jgi:hypothetical protein